MEHRVGLFLPLVVWQLLVNHSAVPVCDAAGTGRGKAASCHRHHVPGPQQSRTVLAPAPSMWEWSKSPSVQHIWQQR